MDKTPVLGTGLSGLVGSKIVAMLSDRYEFTNLDLTNGVDILNEVTVEKALASSSAKILIHCAGFTDVNAAQQQNGDKDGACYRVNVIGTRNIAQACARHGIFLIHLSTAYVFDGQKDSPYVETDTKNPTDWYSVTKSLAEDEVTKELPSAAILRISFPYRQDEFPKADIWHKIAQGLQQGKTGPFFADHFFTMTPIEWLVDVVEKVMTIQPAGIFHTTEDAVYSDFSLAQKIQHQLGLTGELQQSSVMEFNKTAARPYQPSLILNSDKLKTTLLLP